CIVSYDDRAPYDIYTLSLHDALPIYRQAAKFIRGARVLRISAQHAAFVNHVVRPQAGSVFEHDATGQRAVVAHGHIRLDDGKRTDRKSTRLNSSHVSISYAVFCLKKK